MPPFHERIKQVLSALGTTPYKFASEHDGFNKATMFNMLSPDRRPSFEILERMCAVQPRISAEYLLRGEGEPLRDSQLATAKTTVEELIQVRDGIDKRIKELGGES